MATDPPGSTKNLSDGRAEALQALASALAPAESGGAETPSESKEDISKISDRLKELLGDVHLPQGTVQRNERGEPLNEEGLPVIEITEQVEGIPEPAPGASSGAEDTGFVPMYRLPPVERARSRTWMENVLNMLEEEERNEEGRSQARDSEQGRGELEQRNANAKAELERLKAAKEMQKKMGKALLKNMADAREREEKEKARQEKEDLEKEEARRSRKPRKSVSWAELPRSSARSDEDDASVGPSGKLPMRNNVVERFPARSGTSSPPPPAPIGDSDDESNPPEPDPSDSDEGPSDGVPFPGTKHALSDGSDEDEDGLIDSDGSEEDGLDIDIDAVQHQREIALAYFERCNTVGADAAHAAKSAHPPDGENDWEQEYVPLEATLTGPRPKPSQSRFRSERLAHAYGMRLPSSTPPAAGPPPPPPPPGTTALPNPTSALRSAVHMGQVEDGKLVGNGDGDSDGEDDASRVRKLVDAWYRRDVKNASPEDNSDALIKALESTYGAPTPKQPPINPPTTATSVAAEPAHSPPKKSKFKLARFAPPSPLADAEGPREGSSAAAVERKAAPSSSSQAVLPSMIVDSPSFAPPGGDATPLAMTTTMTTIIDTPSFRPPLPSARPARPPTVLAASVRESSSSSGMQQQRAPAPEPELGNRVSRFKAQRAEPC